MALRTKLILMFFAALQVTFLTAVGAFWAVQSWQLLTDDLTLIHEQSRRLARVLDTANVGAYSRRRAPRAMHVRPIAAVYAQALRDHVETLEEAELVGALAAALGLPEPGGTRPAASAPTPSVVSRAAVRRTSRDLKKYYDGKVRQLRARSRFVTRLSSGLFFGIVVIVLTAMMAYFAAIRVWLVRPIQALSRATSIISTGNLDHRIPVNGRDEFGNLAASINSMAASLNEIQRRLLSAERFAMIGEMSAYVAHNIRNPVASIRATAQAELDRMGSDDPRRASYTDVVTAADRIVSWVGDLLRFSNPVALNRMTTDLNKLMSQCVDLMRPRLRDKQVQVVLNLDPALPPVALDKNKMEQVFSAVLTNALDAAPAGSIIEVASGRRMGPDNALHAYVGIADRGNGIPEHRLRTLFTLFSTTKQSGTGLGLAVAHKIITAHNGTITVGNREGGGTLAQISLPAGDGL